MLLLCHVILCIQSVVTFMNSAGIVTVTPLRMRLWIYITTMFWFNNPDIWHWYMTVVTMCQSGEVTATSIFINANTMVHEHEVCSCTVSQFSGEMEIFALPGTVISDCTVKLNFYERLSTTNAAIYSLHCLQDRSFTQIFASTQAIMLNLTGLGTLDICVGIRNTAKSKVKHVYILKHYTH